MADDVVNLVPTKPEAEIAADLRHRLVDALAPICALMDEAAAHGLLVRWDGITPQPPFMKHSVINLRLERHYVG